jgi:hypothetical protein
MPVSALSWRIGTPALSVIGPQAITLKNAPSVSSENLWMACFVLLPKNPKTGHDASAWLRGVTLIPTSGTTLKRHVPLGKNRCPKCAIATAAIIAGLVSACTSSPSIGVLGAYFPDWLFCIVAGVVLTVVIYVIAARLQAGHLMGPSAVVYPTLVVFLALAVWLMLFQH